MLKTVPRVVQGPLDRSGGQGYVMRRGRCARPRRLWTPTARRSCAWRPIVEPYSNGEQYAGQNEIRCWGRDESVKGFFAALKERVREGDDPLSSADGDGSKTDGGAGSGAGGRGVNPGRGENDTPVGYLDFDASQKVQAFDQSINGPRKLGGEGSRKSGQHLRELSDRYYGDLYRDSGLQRRAGELISGWSEDRQANPYRQEVVDAWTKALRGKWPETAVEETVAELYATREERWERLAERIGVETPVGFRAFRGVRGDTFVGDVVEAWRNEGKPYMLARQREAASWSLRPRTAMNFATGIGRHTQAGVILDADVPFEQTLADKLVDDGRFVVPFRAQWEIIVGSDRPNDVLVPTHRVVVVFRDRQYLFEDRKALMAAWEQADA